MPTSAASDNCRRAFFEWSWTTSDIPTDSTITGLTFGFEETNVNSPTNCDYVSMNTHRPTTTSSGATLWSDITSNTIYVSNNSVCAGGVGTNKAVTLSASAITDFQSAVTGSTLWFAMGMKETSETRGATLHSLQVKSSEDGGATPRPTLTVTYTRNFSASVSDTITFTDSISRQVNYARTASDTITFTDAISRQANYTRTVTDSIVFVDSVLTDFATAIREVFCELGMFYGLPLNCLV